RESHAPGRSPRLVTRPWRPHHASCGALRGTGVTATIGTRCVAGVSRHAHLVSKSTLCAATPWLVTASYAPDFPSAARTVIFSSSNRDGPPASCDASSRFHHEEARRRASRHRGHPRPAGGH